MPVVGSICSINPPDNHVRMHACKPSFLSVLRKYVDQVKPQVLR